MVIVNQKKEAFSKLDLLKKKETVTDYDMELASYREQKIRRKRKAKRSKEKKNKEQKNQRKKRKRSQECKAKRLNYDSY